jgi:hypothetical protein
MTKFETTIVFLAALLAVLGYVTILIRRVYNSMKWFRDLPREHEWLMNTVKRNTEDIRDGLEILRTLVERK